MGIPIKLTNDILSNAMRYAVYHYLQKSWTKKETIVYLKVMYVKESTIINTLKGAEETYKQNRNTVITVLHISLLPMWATSQQKKVMIISLKCAFRKFYTRGTIYYWYKISIGQLGKLSCKYLYQEILHLFSSYGFSS